MIKGWLQGYQPQNMEETGLALREIMQEITLAGLYRERFFEKAAFYGGTALRILHGLDRFSEDLDFSLLEPSDDFKIAKYLDAIEEEFSSLGMKVSIQEKAKKIKSNVDAAFLKSDTLWHELELENLNPPIPYDNRLHVKIKIEVDTQPPGGFEIEDKLLLKPFSFYVKTYTLPDLFAGKMHALLFRKWKQRMKGRDWYDMEWYIRKGTPLHLKHFVSRAIDSKDLDSDALTIADFKNILREKINNVSMEMIKEDVRKFIKNDSSIKIWSPSYFLELIEKMTFTSV